MKVRLLQKFQDEDADRIEEHTIAHAKQNDEKGKYEEIEPTEFWNYGSEYKVGLMFGLAKMRDIYAENI